MNHPIKAETKLQILREHLENHVSLAELAEKYHVNVNSIINWKKRLFETGVALFDGTLGKATGKEEALLEEIEKQVQEKDRIIAHLAAENIALKKRNGER